MRAGLIIPVRRLRRMRPRLKAWSLGLGLIVASGCVPAGPVDPALSPAAPLISTWNYSLVPDARYQWHGPEAAAGVYVWSHGKGPRDTDHRGEKPQLHVELFNKAGFDVFRFDRTPNADERERAAGWLRDCLTELRRSGYRLIVAGGQSRGGWTSLQMIDTPGLADAIIAVSPAAHGMGASLNLLGQSDDLRQMLAEAPPQKTRVAFVQFEGDPFIGDAETRVRLLNRLLRRKVGALLVIDRPDGFFGHGAGAETAFSQRFGPCLLGFVTAALPPSSC
jgi:dienelactone hydrolase